MPKLPKTIQKAAEAASVDGGFGPLEAGTYLCRIAEIDTSKTTANGDPKWVFQFDVIDGPEESDEEDRVSTGKLWEHCALTEAAAFKLKAIFAASGFTLDSDADEMVGEPIRIVVVQQEIQGGTRKGQMGNNNVSYLEADPDDARLAS